MAQKRSVPFKTGGEEVFLIVRRLCERILSRSVEEAVRAATGHGLYFEYTKGALAVLALRRLFAAVEIVIETVPAEKQHVAAVEKLAKDIWQQSVGGELTFVARKALHAFREARPSITAHTRKQIVDEHRHVCYICGKSLMLGSSGDDELTLDHIWPNALGGTSESENLLPACKRCQRIKQDAPSWEWFGVHNILMAPDPTSEKLEYSSRVAQIARHTQLAIDLQAIEKTSLKDAFLALGPIGKISHTQKPGHPVTFFHLQTAKR